MKFGKKKQRIDEEEEDIEEDEDSDEETDDNTEQQSEIPIPRKKENRPKQLTKEEIGALAQYHQARALELLDVFRKLE